MNPTLDKVVHQLNLAWAALEDAAIIAYDDGYSPIVWKIKQIELAIEALETEIEDKEYGDDDE